MRVPFVLDPIFRIVVHKRISSYKIADFLLNVPCIQDTLEIPSVNKADKSD